MECYSPKQNQLDTDLSPHLLPMETVIRWLSWDTNWVSWLEPFWSAVKALAMSEQGKQGEFRTMASSRKNKPLHPLQWRGKRDQFVTWNLLLSVHPQAQRHCFACVHLPAWKVFFLPTWLMATRILKGRYYILLLHFYFFVMIRIETQRVVIGRSGRMAHQKKIENRTVGRPLENIQTWVLGKRIWWRIFMRILIK